MVQVSLKVLVGGNTGKEIPVPVERFLIGRSDECHLRPKSDAISRNHCTILVHEDSVTIRDLNSRNGTYVNDERITGDRVLSSGDKLKVAKLEFEVVIKEVKKVAPEPVPVASDTKEKKAAESSSIEFDITEWLEEANAKDKTTKKSDPDTRQFKLDETDRVALEKAAAAGDDSSSGDSSGDSKKFTPPQKKPGKLPERPKQSAANSREAAADMLKKFFNNR
ncbi:MAG: FHA domain-containing protein [Pirellulaceae bacterium]